MRTNYAHTQKRPSTLPPALDRKPNLITNLRAVDAALSMVRGAIACAAMTSAVLVALHHPLWPAGVTTALLGWLCAAWRWPRVWLFVLPAALPALNWAPWTGWVSLDESDLLVLGALAAGHARLATRPNVRAPSTSSRSTIALAALWSIALVGLYRGIVDAGGWDFGWYQSYEEPLNAVRVGKSLVYALLLWPMLVDAHAGAAQRSFQLFAQGMVGGATVVVMTALWERAAMPGLLNISAPYRTVAWFWEMHVGGAAIDAYMVVCTPFVAWTLHVARRRWPWMLAALLALLWSYACLTTFARGAYVGIAIGLFVLSVLLPQRTRPHWRGIYRSVAGAIAAVLLMAVVLQEWGNGAVTLLLLAMAALLWLRWRHAAQRGRRRLASGLLLLALVFEMVLIFGPDSFMSRRAAAGPRDYESRTAHWGRGLALLQSPSQWIWGLGVGRLPAHYDRRAPGGEFPGRVEWVDQDATAGHVVVAGPRSRDELGGWYGLTQRVEPHARYALNLRARSAEPARLVVRVCESHLLYVRNCQWASVTVSGTANWQPYRLHLRGPPLSAGRWFAPRQTVMTLSAVDAGTRIEVDDIALLMDSGKELLRNADFVDGLAHWLPAAQSYFVPWHIDNLFLELLIERGAIGALLLLAVAAIGVKRAMHDGVSGNASRAFVAASLVGVFALGLLSSVQDVPRVALLVTLLMGFSLLRVN